MTEKPTTDFTKTGFGPPKPVTIIMFGGEDFGPFQEGGWTFSISSDPGPFLAYNHQSWHGSWRQSWWRRVYNFLLRR